MKKICLLLFTKLILIGLASTSFGQTGLKRWYFNGNEVDFSTGVPIVNTLPAARVNPKSGSHGMYGSNGDPLFQIIDGNVYNKFGNLVANLLTISPNTGPNYNHVRATDEYAYEMEIVPVPGSECSKFYIFHLESIVSTTSSSSTYLALGHVLRYSEYDLALNNGQGGITPTLADVFLVDFPSEGIPSVTASKPDISGNIKIYVAGNRNFIETAVYRIDVFNGGVSTPQMIWQSQDLSIPTCEVELNLDGSKLAFANLRFGSSSINTSDVMLLNLSSTGTVTSTQSYNLPGTNEQRFTGLEFHPADDKLYVGASGVGIYELTISNGNSTLVTFSQNLGNSHIEIGYDSQQNIRAYVIDDSGSLNEINLTNNVITNLLLAINTIKNGQFSARARPQVYVIPDQIDGYNYDQLFQQSNPICCETLRGFNVFNYTVSTSATWSPASNPISNGGVVEIVDELRIVSGTTLTLQNMQFNFGINGKVIVEQNARLILDNTEFTSTDCNVLWRGIEVWGNYNQHQYLSGGVRFQGYLEIKNGSSIKNANNAIQLWKPGDYTTSGGIVFASNSSFINNRRTAEFISYQNFFPSNPAIKTSYLSNFINCTFEINDQLNNQTAFGAFVTMWEVSGIGFSGCRFLNNAGQFATNQGGHAIYSIDAGYTVSDYCPSGLSPCTVSTIRSEFKNLNTAIEALGATSNRPFNVFNTKFEGNRHSIVNSQVNFCRIVNNDFLFQPHFVAGTKTGIQINQATGFEIIHNRFNSEEDIDIENYGIVSNNTGTADNEIYANSFYDIKRAMWAVQNNSGLLFGCNVFERCGRDIFIQDQGVYSIQAYGSLSAGNIFSHLSPPDGDLSNGSTQSIKYYHHGGQSEPLYYTPLTITLHTLATNDCPSRLNTGGVPVSTMRSSSELPTLKADFYQNFEQLITAKYNYGQLIDGGNGAYLLQQVVNNWSDEIWIARQELLNQSPYLSQEFLIDLAVSNTLPQAILLEVILANPEATHNEDFLTFLQYEAPQTFSGLQIQLIIESWDNPTPRASIERLIASSRQNCLRIANAVTRHYLADTTLNAADSLNAWLNIGHWFELGLAAVNENLLSNDYASVNGALQTLQLQFDQEYEQENINRMLSLATLLENIDAYAANYYEMNEQDENNLLAFALLQDDIASMKAKNILTFYKNHTFPNDILNSAAFRKAPISRYLPSVKPISTMRLQVYPNPAKAFVNFNLTGWHEVSTLLIYNAQGQIIHQMEVKPTGEGYVLNTSNWPSGLYQYRLMRSNENLGAGKFMITQ